MNRILVFLFILFFQLIHAQTVTIGLLADKKSKEVEPLLEELKTEIRAVIGEGKTVVFKDVLENNYDATLAKANYEVLIASNADIIVSFGVLNNIVLYQQKNYTKPVIVFSSINSDLINLPPQQETSNTNNIAYIITPSSYKEDLETFEDIYDYQNIGIVLDDYIIDRLPVKAFFDDYFASKNKKYRLISLSENGVKPSDLERIDAVYIAGGFQLSDEKFAEMATTINAKKLPSFSAVRMRDIELGILATNQPETNIEQYARRIALDIEAIVDGANASELPLYLDYKKKLTINHDTAKQINLPLRYAMLGYADFVGSIEKVESENSLSLLDIMGSVVNRNLSLSSARKNIDLSTQDVKTAKSNYLPNVTAGVTGAYIDPDVAEISNGTNPELSTTGNVALEQLVYSQDATTNIGIQKDLQKAEQERYNATELDALLNAAVSYFNALILKTNTNLQNQNLKLTKRNLEIAQQNFEGGASGKSDVLRFRSQLAQNTQSLIDAENQLLQGYYTINQLMNTTINKEIDIDDAFLSEGVFKNYKYDDFYAILDNPVLRPTLIEFLVEEAKKNAPELKGINYNLSATKRSYWLSGPGRFIPTVALQGQYNLLLTESGKGTTAPENFPNPPDGSYNVGVSLSLPIFNQNRNNINRQTAKIQEEQLGFEKSNIELTIEKNVNDIILDIISQVANIEISKISEAAAKESLELTQNAYKEGAVPVIQLIDAQTNYLQAQLASATATYNYLLTSIQLERAIGYIFLVHTEAENQQFLERINTYILSKN